jgi:riboflavin biosynthesis pyrimidine reductase
MGKLRWSGNEIEGDHLICVVSERVSLEYLEMLRNTGISYIVSGDNTVDLPAAMSLLGERFNIRTLLLEGGGHINGAFLNAGLVDELSLLIAPGIDGRHEVAAVFDGIASSDRKAVQLELTFLERRQKDTLWLRYKVSPSKQE